MALTSTLTPSLILAMKTALEMDTVQYSTVQYSTVPGDGPRLVVQLGHVEVRLVLLQQQLGAGLGGPGVQAGHIAQQLVTQHHLPIIIVK